MGAAAVARLIAEGKIDDALAHFGLPPVAELEAEAARRAEVDAASVTVEVVDTAEGVLVDADLPALTSDPELPEDPPTLDEGDVDPIEDEEDEEDFDDDESTDDPDAA